MPEINISDSRGRDALVAMAGVRSPLKVRWVDSQGRQSTGAKLLKGTLHRDIEALKAQSNGNLAEVGAIVAKISIDYKLPLTMDDGTIDIWTRCSRIGNKSLDLEQVIVRNDGAVAAAAVTVAVVYDYRANTSVPLPEAWKPLLLAGKV